MFKVAVLAPSGIVDHGLLRALEEEDIPYSLATDTGSLDTEVTAIILDVSSLVF